ncbi:MAG: porin [Porticoccaceae bacterium]
MNKYVFQRGSLVTALGLALGLSCVSGAQALSADEIEIHGFFTAGATISDIEHTYLRTTDEDISFDEDSVLGLQLIVPIDERIVLQAQLLANSSKEDQANFELNVDWAFATYALNDSVDIRAGRIRYPLLMLSDYAEVGYSYPWIRPPQEMYGLIPITSFDGIDALITVPVGGFQLNIQPYGGSKDDELHLHAFHQTTDVELDNIMGARFTLSNDYLTFSLAANTFDLTIGDAHEGHGMHHTFTPDLGVENIAAGVNLDWNNLLVMTEYFETRYDDADPGDAQFSDSESWYAMVGYRFGKLTPHITFSELKTDDPQGGIAQESLTVGLRYELSTSSALKFEWTNAEPQDGTLGLFNVDSLEGEDDANVYSIALDLVF